MSSVSGIGQGLYQYLQGLQGSSSSTSTQAASTTSSSGQSSTAAALTGSTTGSTQGSGHHHHHGGGLLSQIESAVTSALQNSQSSGTTSDPNQVITNAIEQVLGGTGSTTGTASPGQTSAQGASDSQSTFEQTLQQYGVTSDQFRQDFMTALQSLQGSSGSAASALLASGTLVNTLA